MIMHSGREKRFWGFQDWSQSMHPGKEIEQKGARRAPINPWVYIVWVKRTVSIKGTVGKKVHVSLLNVPYDPRIGTIIS